MRVLLSLSTLVFGCVLVGCGSSDDPDKNMVNPTANAAPDPNAPPPTQKNLGFGGSSKETSGFGNN